MKLTKIISSLAIAAAVALGTLGAPNLRAQDPAPAAPVVEKKEEAAKPEEPKKDPTIEQRLADIEAYMNNGERSKKEEGVASKVAGPGPGHNAWQMTSTALVLFMTLPGLALFYGGLVRRKNVLSVLAQCLGIAGLVTILWWVVRLQPELSARATPSSVTSAYAFFKGVEPGNVGAGYHWISDSIWAMFQLTFAIITPALIVGAIAERMKFSAVLLFVALWMFVVYFPLAHMVWGTTGFMCGPLNPDAAHQGDRLRRRHRRAHDLRLERAGALHHPRQAPRLRQREDGPAQHGALYGRHRHALGRLVRLQCRLRARRRRHRLERLHHHHARRGAPPASSGRVAGMDAPRPP